MNARHERRAPAALVLAFVVSALLAGCAGQGSRADTGAETTRSASATAPPAMVASGTPTPTPSVDPARVGANELGLVPVLMYHQLKDHPKGVYDITPAAFRAELERLAAEDYVPVTAAAFSAGRIDIPAGKHPVVLTFDDSTRSQLTLDAAGHPVAGTAVAILLEVAARHPGFTPTATFFVNGNPFAEPGGHRYLSWLHDHGFEVANHTIDHANLRSVSATEVRHQLAADTAMIEKALPGTPVETLALPLGMRPHDHRLMMAGESGGTSYRHLAAFLVGAGPAPSPNSRRFDPTGVPRIRSQGRSGPDARFASARTLDRLAKAPATRYTSDGDPSTISFPKPLQPDLAPSRQAAARPY